MKKVLILLLMFLLLPGCAAQKSAAPLFPDATSSMTVDYFHCTGTGSWDLCAEEIEAVYAWAEGLRVRKTTFPEGDTPYDAEGGEVSIFRAGDDSVSFVAGQYLEKDGQWYALQSQTTMPVPLAG